MEGDQPKFILEESNPRMEAALNYIVGFKIEITSWEGKYKISQDKIKKDQERAKQAMMDSQTQITENIERLYLNHQTKN
jgi:transcriptional regulator